MRFNFANLRGGGKAKAADESDDKKDEDAAADEDEAPEEEASSDDETTPEDKEAKSEDEEEEATEKERAAHRRGRAAGRKAERERCAAIFAAASPGQVEMAANMAFNTKVSPGEAKALLGSAPRSGGGLAARMSGQDPAPAGKAEASGSEDDKVAARILSTRGRKAG